MNGHNDIGNGGIRTGIVYTHDFGETLGFGEISKT
jgi:hypothetical protein